MASILLAAVAGSPSSQHLPGREPPCYLEDVKARGKFSLGECKKLFLNFTTADDVQKLGFAIQKTTALREIVMLEPTIDSAGAGALGAGVARGGQIKLLMVRDAIGLDDSYSTFSLVQGLAASKSLEAIRLINCSIGASGAASVAQHVMKSGSSVRHLTLEGNAQYDSGLGDATCDALVDLIRAKAPPPALVALDLRGNVALESCSEAVAKALLDTRKSRKPAVEELWFPINDQQEGSGAVDLVQQLEYAEVMGHDEL